MNPELLAELKTTIESLLKAHAAMMKEFIPAKAGLAPEIAKMLEPHITKVEMALNEIQNAKTESELRKAINEANALFSGLGKS